MLYLHESNLTTVQRLRFGNESFKKADYHFEGRGMSGCRAGAIIDLGFGFEQH